MEPNTSAIYSYKRRDQCRFHVSMIISHTYMPLNCRTNGRKSLSHNAHVVDFEDQGLKRSTEKEECFTNTCFTVVFTDIMILLSFDRTLLTQSLYHTSNFEIVPKSAKKYLFLGASRMP